MMNIFCIDDFKVAFEKLKSKKSYNTIEKEVINYFFKETAQDLCSGTRLNHSSDSPYIKKRLGGSGGFRFYFLLIIKKEALYLMFVHPKTGAIGSDNITDESKAYLYKKVLGCINTKDFYKMTLDKTGKKLSFEKSK